MGRRRRNIFRAVRIDKENGHLYDHRVDIVSLIDSEEPPLKNWDIRREIELWCVEQEARVAVGENQSVWFAHESDAMLFYLAFS